MSSEVPSPDFVKQHYATLVPNLNRSIASNNKSREGIAPGSNMEQLIEVWAAGESSGSAGIKTPLLILTEVLLSKVDAPITTELHPASGDQKVIFDKENNFYVTVVKSGGKLLIAGIGSALGNHVTAKFEEQISG